MHGVTVVCCAMAIGALVVAASRRRLTRREQTIRHTFAFIGLAWQAFATVWWLLPRNYDATISLPFQLCDFAGVIGPLALVTQARPLRALLYFWGIGFSTEAFITPILEDGPATVHFWLFWVGHTLIVGAAVYDLVVLGFRPAWRDYRFVTLVSFAYLGAIVPFNMVFGLNYGYVGDTLPEARTMLDVLGSWPLRIVWIILLGQTLLTLIWIPWIFACRPEKRVFSPHNSS